MANETDYKKAHSQIYDLLPNVYRSEVNKAVSRNIFERFLTKSELVNIVGTITNDHLDPLRLPEQDVHRQNFQLQPLLYSKIATVDHISSFKDMVRELLRLGVNYDRMDEWLSADQFNFMPPVDIDKIINYSSYYWLGNTEPQYITIKNRLNQLAVIVQHALEDVPELATLVPAYDAEEDPIQKQALADQIEALYPGFVLLYEEYRYLQSYQTAHLSNIDGWDGILDGLAITQIDPATNAFVVKGNYANILNSLPIVAPNFFPTIRVKQGANAGEYTLSTFAVFNPINNTTVVSVDQPIPAPMTTVGVIDVGTYDAHIDGLSIVASGISLFVVDGDFSVAINTLGEFEVDGGPNAGTYTVSWVNYDPSTNTTTIATNEPLVDPISLSGVIVLGKYDYVIENAPNIPNPHGFHVQNDPWSASNMWVHTADVPSTINLSTVHRAQQPIIEYEPFIELNQWAMVRHQWRYSNDGEHDYNNVDVEPSDLEVLAPAYSNQILSTLTTTSFEIVATENNPKLAEGVEVTIEYDDGERFSYHTITDIQYGAGTAVVTVDGVIYSSFGSATLHPIRYTSLGDDWKGFTRHWLYVKRLVPVPCDNQVESSVYDLLSPEYDSTRSFVLSAAGPSVNWYPLPGVLIHKHDEVRVYVNNTRLYGAYALGHNETFYTDSSGNYDAIYLFAPLLSGQLRVEVGPIAQVDEEKRTVYVKMNPDDTSLTPVSLVRYIKAEQTKTSVNQYPLFNMYNMDGSSAFKASPLWKFLESPDYIINPRIGKRIVADYNTSVYTFEQLLLEQDNGRMYAYKQHDAINTVWRTDDFNRRYVPQYIDTTYTPVPIGDPSGDWELPKQMVHNLEHENRVVLSTTELLTHFTTIIQSQPNPPGFNGALQNRWRLLPQPLYGAGGTIKEFSDGLDTFLSSIFVTTVNTIQLIDFAKREYENNIRRIRTLLTDNIVELLSTTDSQALANFGKFISDAIIKQFGEDDYFERVYGDSTAFDPITQTGVRNWIASLPRFGLLPAVTPKLLVDERLGFAELTHHDGHKSNPRLQPVVVGKLSQALRSLDIVTSDVLANRPDVASTPMGAIFYATDVSKLFKCVVSSYGPTSPEGTPDGSFWYDTSTDELTQNQNGVFVVVDRELCWSLIDFNTLYADVLFEIETRLFDVCQNQPMIYDLRNVKTDVEYDANEQTQFARYVAEQQIADPYASTYAANNAFSWNYSAVDVNDYNVLTIPTHWSTQSPSTWYNIYQDVYGTRHPHLEPWVLQGYTTKPTWWDVEYKTHASRRWSLAMWDNILDAIVPVGYELPDGNVSTGAPQDGGVPLYQVIPVNITDNATTDMLYQPDDLLPPYYTSSDPADADVLSHGVLLNVLPNQTAASQPFEYGQNGFTEDVWRNSIESPYALARISYITQPMRFTYYTFGNVLDEINGLQVDLRSNTIPSHRDALFHGDMIGKTIYHFNGINQWYVNFLRFNSRNLNSSDFRELWTTWKPVLSYQLSSFVDARSIHLRNDAFQFDESDFNLRTKRTPGFRDHYIESLSVVVHQMGDSVLRRGVRVPSGKGDDWSFRVTTANPQNIPLQIYGVNSSSTTTTFDVLRREVNQDAWNHYQIDRDQILTFIPGTAVDSLGPDYQGIQGLINFIDGYVAYLEDQGFVFNDSNHNTLDPVYGRIDNWQLQIEKMIEQIYVGMVTDTLPIYFVGKWGYVVVDPTTDVFTASTANSFTFAEGEHIQFHSTGTLPQPLQEHVMYEMVNVDHGNKTFQVKPIGGDTIINITTMGRGTITFGVYRIETTLPQAFFELNPFKYTIVFDNEVGIIANVHEGSFDDITSEQGIYDQYGRPLKSKDIRVFRGDQRSTIRMFQNVPDDITPESSLHVGGMHLFLDGHEHVIMFENHSVNGGLLFDSFLGSQINKVILNARTNYSKTFRPNIGGRYLLDDVQHPNIEAAIGELQYMYDAHLADEDSELIKAGRELLGFETSDYFDELGITPKSQFLFYRGMIQQKGSFNAIKAFINLRLFIDANVDDYWAYKVCEFGDAREKEFPRLNLKPTDTTNNMLLLRFKTDLDNRPLRDYIDVTLNDPDRWYNQPTQIKDIFGNVPNQHFEAEVTDYAALTSRQLGTPMSDKYGESPLTGKLIHSKNGYVRLPVKCDDVTIVVSQPNRVYEFKAKDDGPFSTFDGEYEGLSEAIIPHASSLTVYISRGDEAFKMIPQVEIDEGDDGKTIRVLRYLDDNGLPTDIEKDDVIQIHVGNATLVENTHYTRINSQLIYFDREDGIQSLLMYDDGDDVVNGTTNPLGDRMITFFCHNPAESKLNPAKLIDNSTKVMLENVTIWNPALGHHYHNAYVNIDQISSDPAYYTHSLIPSDINRSLAWMDRNEGYVWMDQDRLSYKPYQDNKLNANFTQRLKLWGQVEDWAAVELYEWVKSPVAPSEYEVYVTEQQNKGVTISGTPRSSCFKRVRNSLTDTFDQPWVELKDFILKDILIPIDGFVFDVDTTIVDDGSLFELYENGVLKATGTVVDGKIDITPIAFNLNSFITLRVPAYQPTDDELKFDPDVEDDNSINVQYKIDYKYVREDRVSANGRDTDSTYYFWARHTATSHNGISLDVAEQQMTKNPQSYIVFDNLVKTSKFTTDRNTTVVLPNRYTRCAVRGLVNKVNAEGRYFLQFTRNFILRDDHEDVVNESILRNKHTQWKMFRQRQKYNIDRYLWNKLTEACSGRSLADATQAVPALDYVLYDEQFNTNTRFGLDNGQAFIDSQRGIEIVIGELNDPDYDLYPVNREEFFNTYSFDTAENIERAMIAIYETFLPEHINRIWFAVLYEALAATTEFKGLFKTSWVQLDGVRLLDTSGVLQ